MATSLYSEIWVQSRRIGETKGRITALEDIRLRLIEMSDGAAAEAVRLQINGLRAALEYQQQVMIAMQARVAVRRLETMFPAAHGMRERRSDRPAHEGWHELASPPLQLHGEAD